MNSESDPDIRLALALEVWAARQQQLHADVGLQRTVMLQLRRRERLRRSLPAATTFFVALVIVASPAGHGIAAVWQQLQLTTIGGLLQSPWQLLAAAMAVGTALFVMVDQLDPVP